MGRVFTLDACNAELLALVKSLHDRICFESYEGRVHEAIVAASSQCWDCNTAIGPSQLLAKRLHPAAKQHWKSGQPGIPKATLGCQMNGTSPE